MYRKKRAIITYGPNGEFQWRIIIKTEAIAPEFLVDSFQHSFPVQRSSNNEME